MRFCTDNALTLLESFLETPLTSEKTEHSLTFLSACAFHETNYALVPIHGNSEKDLCEEY